MRKGMTGLVVRKRITVLIALLLIAILAGCASKAPEDAADVVSEEGAQPHYDGTEEAASSVDDYSGSSEDTQMMESTERTESEETAESTETAESIEMTESTGTEERAEAAEEAAFYITEITDEIFSRIEGKSFKEDCTLPREDLRYLHVLHVDLDGETHEGEMIVNVHIAEDVLEILRRLYEEGYPIEKMRLIDEYGADDEASMEDNNSSSFNFRFISHTTKVSKHGLGLAVDINTLYNPYVKVVDGERIVEPVTGEPYVDRSAAFPYKIVRDDLCCSLFLAHGFEWGGDWESRKDYQHFEVPDERIRQWYPQYS